jgi:hypothetical protein
MFRLRAYIDEKFHQLVNSAVLNLTARKASLVFAQKNTTAGQFNPTIDKYDAVYPAADGGTVLRYIFNEASGAVIDSSGNGNNGTVNGTMTRRADGWADYSLQGDGTTGYVTSGNSGSFPTGTNEREIDLVFTYMTSSDNNFLWWYGIGNNTSCMAYISGGSVAFDANTVSLCFANNYVLEVGKTYFVSILFSGTYAAIYINGVLVQVTTAPATNTAAGNLYIGRRADGASGYNKHIYHYLEIRNKMRTPQQIAQISNKLCLPCHYTGYWASYPPNPTDTGYHCWKFDDASGNTVTDEAGTMNGTATGAAIIDSQIGLSKARKYNGTSDYIACGNYQFGSTITIIAVLNSATMSNNQNIISNHDGNVTGNAFRVSWNGNGKLTVGIDNAAGIASDAAFPVGIPAFAAFVINSGMVTFYVNSPYPDSTKAVTLNTSRNGTMFIGGIGGPLAQFSGTYECIYTIPRALSQPEIAQYYNSFMKQGDRTIIDDCLPANSLPIGFVRSNSTVPIESNDTDYKYGRNEGGTKAEGNKRLFLGWKYFSGAETDIGWDNPFGTRKIKTYYKYAEDPMGKNESDVHSAWISGTAYRGIYPNSLGNASIRIHVFPNGITTISGIDKTSGYIGCYAEVL